MQFLELFCSSVVIILLFCLFPGYASCQIGVEKFFRGRKSCPRMSINHSLGRTKIVSFLRRVSAVEKGQIIISATLSCHLQDLFGLFHRRLCLTIRLRMVWASASMVRTKELSKRLKSSESYCLARCLILLRLVFRTVRSDFLISLWLCWRSCCWDSLFQKSSKNSPQ